MLSFLDEMNNGSSESGGTPDQAAPTYPQAENFYVSPSDGSDSNPGTRVLPFQTITAALDSCVAARGDVIYLGIGSYNENIVIDKRAVRIRGQHKSPTTTGCNIFGQGGAPAILVTALSTELTGFRVNCAEGQAGIKFSDAELGNSGVAVIRNVRFNAGPTGPDQASLGLWLFGAQFMTIDRCLFHDLDIGIGVAGGTIFQPQNIEVSDCTFTFNGSRDISTLASGQMTPGSNAIFNSNFRRLRFLDQAVTKHIDFGTGDLGGEGILIYDALFNRDVVSDGLVDLQKGAVLYGRDHTGDITIIGA